MGDAEEPAEEPGAEPRGERAPADRHVDRHVDWPVDRELDRSAAVAGSVNRDALGGDGPPGQPLSHLLFACAEHGEEKTVEYYDPDDPPRCAHGDLMARKRR